MKDKIMENLKLLEAKNDVQILYAVESGSRGWGFESKDSDYDVRFLYLRKKDWYLAIDKRNDFIECPINDLLDINGWDIKKAFGLFKKSNPTLFEWLSSPIVYIDECGLAESLRALATEYFLPIHSMYHYLHIAKNKYDEILSEDNVKIKKYFYILRPLFACMWIEKNYTMPPMEFSKLIQNMVIEPHLNKYIEALLEKKRAGLEYDIEAKNPELLEYFKKRIVHFGHYLKIKHENKKTNYDSLNSLFLRIVEDFGK